MMKRRYPTIAQVNGLFLFTALITLLGSIFFQLRLGIGTNLWINEFVYILLPPLLMVRLSKWPQEDIFRFKKTSSRNKITSMFAGVSMWFFVYYIGHLIVYFLDSQVGTYVLEMPKMSVYQSLLILIGTVVLAPICEEIFFRGFMQKAYEGHFRKYGFVIVGLIFGYYHVLNGIANVIPASILGISMGYLVYKTGSISTSMIFHAMSNLSAVVFGSVFATIISTSIPLWLHILSITALCISLILLRSIKDEPKSDDIIEEPVEEKKISWVALALLIVSALYLTAIGVFEILSRLKIM